MLYCKKAPHICSQVQELHRSLSRPTKISFHPSGALRRLHTTGYLDTTRYTLVLARQLSISLPIRFLFNPISIAELKGMDVQEDSPSTTIQLYYSCIYLKGRVSLRNRHWNRKTVSQFCRLDQNCMICKRFSTISLK